LDDILGFVIDQEKIELDEVTDYEQVKDKIVTKLRELKAHPRRKETPKIYHLDVSAMYPNIILTNRLQPTAIVDESHCSSCIHNQPENSWYHSSFSLLL